MATASPELHIAAGSGNPVKLAAVAEAFKLAFPGRDIRIHGCKAESGVPDQPVGDSETRLGAMNRARHALDLVRAGGLDPDFSVGLEGGVVEEGWAEPGHSDDVVKHLSCMAWMAVMHVASSRWGVAKTGQFALPDSVAKLVRSGVELGIADDQVFGRSNSKHGSGAVGLLTCGMIDRQQYYVHALTLAMCPFLHPEHYGVEAVPGARQQMTETHEAVESGHGAH